MSMFVLLIVLFICGMPGIDGSEQGKITHVPLDSEQLFNSKSVKDPLKVLFSHVSPSDLPIVRSINQKCSDPYVTANPTMQKAMQDALIDIYKGKYRSIDTENEFYQSYSYLKDQLEENSPYGSYSQLYHKYYDEQFEKLCLIHCPIAFFDLKTKEPKIFGPVKICPAEPVRDKNNLEIPRLFKQEMLFKNKKNPQVIWI